MVAPIITPPLRQLSEYLPSHIPRSQTIPSIQSWSPRPEQDHNLRALQGSTFNEISHWLNGTMTFSKQDTKYSLWSVHFNEKSRYLTKNPQREVPVLSYAFWSEDVPGCLSDVHRPDHWLPTRDHWHSEWYLCLWKNPWGAWKSPDQADEDCLKEGLCLTAASTWSGSYESAFIVQCSPPKAWSLTLPKPSPPRPHHLWQSDESSVLLGLINYLQPSIQGLADKTSLQEQLSKWDLNPLTDAVFQWMKTWICSTFLKTTLIYYDRIQSVIVQTDASEYGLGIALVQNGWPITFVSNTPTDVETWYANIK